MKLKNVENDETLFLFFFFQYLNVVAFEIISDPRQGEEYKRNDDFNIPVVH